jgi:hypothetical protein
MEQNTDTETSLMNKKQDELTVGDSIKIQVYALGAIALVYGTVVGGAVGYNKFADWRNRKAAEKVLNVVDTTATEKED